MGGVVVDIARTSPAGEGSTCEYALSLRPARPWIVCTEPAWRSKTDLRNNIHQPPNKYTASAKQRAKAMHV